MDELTSDAPGARLDAAVTRGTLVLRLAGELDLTSVPALAAVTEDLLAQPARPAVIDMSAVRFMDSSGVALLIRLANHFGSTTLEHPSPLVRRTLETLGLSQRLRVAERPIEFRQSLPRDPTSVAAARAHCREVVRQLPDEVAETAVLLVSELATNAVLHGRGERYEVAVAFSSATGELSVGATDSLDGEPRVMNPDINEEHGRGLQLVAALAERWGVERDDSAGTKTVWFALTAHPPAPPA